MAGDPNNPQRGAKYASAPNGQVLERKRRRSPIGGAAAAGVVHNQYITHIDGGDEHHRYRLVPFPSERYQPSTT